MLESPFAPILFRSSREETCNFRRLGRFANRAALDASTNTDVVSTHPGSPQRRTTFRRGPLSSSGATSVRFSCPVCTATDTPRPNYHAGRRGRREGGALALELHTEVTHSLHPMVEVYEVGVLARRGVRSFGRALGISLSFRAQAGRHGRRRHDEVPSLPRPKRRHAPLREHLLAKVDVAGSTPVSRSKLISTLDTSSVLAGLSYPD